MTDLRPEGDPRSRAVGWRIRSSHPNGFRHNREGADAWATVLAVVTTESKREAYVVRFDDGATDLWVVDDPSDPYLLAPAPRLPPNEVAPQLLANVRERGDNWGDLANATGDELRDALRLAARQLNAFHDQLRARAMESGPYMIGLWTDELDHVDPCDCDLDEENAGTNCMANSDWTYAVLVDGGAFAAQPVVKLPRRLPYREEDEVPDLAELLTRVDPDPNAG